MYGLVIQKKRRGKRHKKTCVETSECIVTCLLLVSTLCRSFSACSSNQQSFEFFFQNSVSHAGFDYQMSLFAFCVFGCCFVLFWGGFVLFF